MPKILVVFYSRSTDTAALAEAVADGAESVRFTEVDLRRLEDNGSAGNAEPAPIVAGATAARVRYQSLGSAEELRAYDGIVLGAELAVGAMPAELETLLADATRLCRAGALENTVGAAFTSWHGSGQDAGWPIVRALAGLGMIIVPAEGGGATSAESARSLGRRVARVTGWVHHALGHEQERARGHGDAHTDAHGHSHAHGAGDGHEHSHGHSHEHDHRRGHEG